MTQEEKIVVGPGTQNDTPIPLRVEEGIMERARDHFAAIAQASARQVEGLPGPQQRKLPEPTRKKVDTKDFAESVIRRWRSRY